MRQRTPKVLALLMLILGVVFAHAQRLTLDQRLTVQGQLELTETTACVDAYGNTYIAGISGVQYFPSPRSAQAVVQKISPSGGILWTDTFDDPPSFECHPTSILVDGTSHAFVTGFCNDPLTDAYGVFVLHIGPTGSTIWSVVDANYSASLGLALDASGDPIIGATASSGWYVDLIKYDRSSSGVVWNHRKNFSTDPFDAGYKADASGHLYVSVPDGYNVATVIRCDETSGSTLWQAQVTPQAPFSDYEGMYLAIAPSGDLLLSGQTWTTGSNSTHVATLDLLNAADGSFRFRKLVGPSTAGFNTLLLTAPVVDALGEPCWIVQTTTPVPNYKVSTYIGKSTNGGNVEWYKNLPGGLSYQLEATPSGKLITCWGHLTNVRTITEFGSSGSTLWQVSTGPVFSDRWGTLQESPDESAVFAGTFIDASNNSAFAALRLRASDGATTLFVHDRPIANVDNTIWASTRDPAGNMYVVGTQNLGLYVAKLTSGGSVIWRTAIGASGADSRLNPCAICYWSGFVAVAAMAGYGPIVGKLNATNGTAYWTAREQGTQNYDYVPSSIKFDSTMNVDVGYGSFYSDSIISGVAQFASSSGKLQWLYTTQNSDTSGQIAVDQEDNVFAAGFLSSGFQLTKLSKSGNVIFSTIEPAGNGFMDSVGLQYDPVTSTVFLAGSEENSATSEGSIDCGRYDSKGNQIWYESIPVANHMQPYHVSALYFPPSHTLYIATGASSTSSKGYPDLIVEKVDAYSGQLNWQTVSSLGADVGFSLAGASLDRFGNPTVASPFGVPDITFGGSNGLYLVKLNGSDGSVRWSTKYQGS